MLPLPRNTQLTSRAGEHRATPRAALLPMQLLAIPTPDAIKELKKQDLKSNQMICLKRRCAKGEERQAGRQAATLEEQGVFKRKYSFLHSCLQLLFIEISVPCRLLESHWLPGCPAPWSSPCISSGPMTFLVVW